MPKVQPQPSDHREPFRPIEFRLRRLEIPPCPECVPGKVTVAVRTDYVVYLRCTSCGQVWSVPRPDVAPLA